MVLSFGCVFIVPHPVEAQKLQTRIEKLEECGSKPGGCDWSDFLELIQEGINFLFFLASLAIVVVISYAGWLFLTGGTNEGNIKKAKGLLWNVVWGIIFMFTGWLIVSFVLSQLGVDEPGYWLLR